MKQLAFLLPFFQRYRRHLVGGILAILASATVGLLAPLVIGRAVDDLKAQVDPQALLGYGGLLVAIAVVQGLFTYAQRMVLVTMSRHIEFDVRNRYFAHLERLDPGFYHQSYTGDLMARGTNDLNAVRMVCGPAIMYGSNTIFTCIGALAFMLAIHGKLTLLALAPMPLVALATKVFGEKIHVLFEKVQERFSAVTSKVQEHLSGVRVVRAYAREDHEVAAFDVLNQSYVEQNRKLIRWNAAFNPALQGLVGLGYVVVLWYGGTLVTQGQLTVGQFVTFNFFLGKLVWPMIAVGWVINLVQRASASMGRIQNVLAREPAIIDEEPLIDMEALPGGLKGAVRFRDLTFTYPEAEAPTLREIDLEIPAGSTVALVGRTGSGKSSLVSLLPRLADAPEGSVQIDGVDLRRFPLAALRGAIAMVPQETFLFSATVGENIAFGRPEASRDEILAAAEAAGLDRDLEGFPQGLETVVGERGITLSGGQKQRVALARALLRRPRILILDDCLSAVDTQTEERILGHLRRLFEGRTVFLISHRISTVKEADLVLVLEDGRIAERGRHDELVALGGLYADLHRRQRLEDELAAV